MATKSVQVSQCTVDLNRDRFLRSLLRTLAGTLEDVVGLGEAEGYISVVGHKVGQEIDSAYRKALDVHSLDRDQVAEVLVNLKERIEGDFYVISESEDKIVLGNRACPFGDFVKGRDSLCMMTSNVFGRIAADNLGYASVELEETIARGNNECRVVINLNSDRPAPPGAREYFREISSTGE